MLRNDRNTSIFLKVNSPGEVLNINPPLAVYGSHLLKSIERKLLLIDRFCLSTDIRNIHNAALTSDKTSNAIHNMLSMGYSVLQRGQGGSACLGIALGLWWKICQVFVSKANFHKIEIEHLQDGLRRQPSKVRISTSNRKLNPFHYF